MAKTIQPILFELLCDSLPELLIRIRIFIVLFPICAHMAFTKLIRAHNDIENTGRAGVIDLHGAHHDAIELRLQPRTLIEPIERGSMLVAKLPRHPHYRSRIIARRVR